MALQKVKDSMRTTTALDSTKLSGAVPSAALSNVDLVEGTKGADIASSSTIVIGTDGGYFDITGTTGIAVMTVAAGRVFTLQFDGVVTSTHSSTLYLSGAANFTTEANDHMTFISVAANDVRQIGTGLKDGGSPVAAAGGVDGITTSANATAISISADEEVTMPLQPYFLANMGSNVSNITGTGNTYTIIWTTERYDIGSNFTTSTYTAPITGKYLITSSVHIANMTGGTLTAIGSNIVTSNRTYGNYYYSASIDNGTTRTVKNSTVADMDAGDTIIIQIRVNGLSSNVVDLENGNGYDYLTVTLIA